MDRGNRVRLTAALLSLVVGSVLMAGKFLAFRMTGSTAIFSDALESIVNVLAAAFAVGGILFAGRPADRGHPYGHGKIEFFSAAFEGGLIAFAAVVIVYQAIESLIHGPELRQLNLGLAITAGAGALNALLGWILIRTGRRYDSLILIADGKHVLSDFLTTVGILIGLALVRITEVLWLDPVVAIVVAIALARTGVLLVRHAARALLDEEDTYLLQRLLEAGEQAREPGIIRMHHLRAIRVGSFVHVDAHLVVPEFWSVDHAHDRSDAFERRLLDRCSIDGEIVFHTDPCRQIFCEACDLADCPIRARPFVERPRLTLDEATLPDEAPGQPPLVTAITSLKRG
ncbi:MAG: cation diffusion facilitator family transporter [Candidatus Eisenbacteria bacterium]